MTQFLEGPTPPPPLIRRWWWGGGGCSNYELKAEQFTTLYFYKGSLFQWYSNALRKLLYICLIKWYKIRFGTQNPFLFRLYFFNLLNAKVAIIQKPKQSKSIDWFLYDGNFEVYWINMFHSIKKLNASTNFSFSLINFQLTRLNKKEKQDIRIINVFKRSYFIKSFLTNVLILYPLKTPQNQRFSGVFRGYKIGTLATKWIKLLYQLIPKIRNTLSAHTRKLLFFYKHKA